MWGYDVPKAHKHISCDVLPFFPFFPVTVIYQSINLLMIHMLKPNVLSYVMLHYLNTLLKSCYLADINVLKVNSVNKLSTGSCQYSVIRM